MAESSPPAGNWIRPPSLSLRSQRRSSTRTRASSRCISLGRARIIGRICGAAELAPTPTTSGSWANSPALASGIGRPWPSTTIERPPCCHTAAASRCTTEMTSESGKRRTMRAVFTQPTCSTRPRKALRSRPRIGAFFCRPEALRMSAEASGVAPSTLTWLSRNPAPASRTAALCSPLATSCWNLWPVTMAAIRPMATRPAETPSAQPELKPTRRAMPILAGA